MKGGLVGRLRAWLAPWLRELGGEPMVIVAGSCALLIISHYQGSTGFFRRTFGAQVASSPIAGALPYFWWFGTSVVLYLFAPLLLARVTGGAFTRRYGLGLGDWRAGLKLSLVFLAVMAPAVWIASGTKMFSGAYPLAGQHAYMMRVSPEGATRVMELNLWLFIAYEAAYFLYFVGWEFFFRGWMLNGLLPRFGRGGAILIQTVPFALMHLGKPEAEALGSIVAGIALAFIARRYVMVDRFLPATK